MDVRFVASFSVITTDPEAEQTLFADRLGIPLRQADEPDTAYVFTEDLEGTKHFGVWPLSEAAVACFGSDTWPDTHPVPQASIEFEVDDVPAAAAELEASGHTLLHPARIEPWGQTVARLQSVSGIVVGLSYTPWLRS